MSTSIRMFECVDCGQWITRRRKSEDPKICAECGIARAVSAAHAMVQRDGPAWEAHQRNPGGRPRRSPPPTE